MGQNGQRPNCAVARNAQIELSKEEYASGMGRGSSDALLKDVRIKLRKEEYAVGMGPSGRGSDAAVKDVQTM